MVFIYQYKNIYILINSVPYEIFSVLKFVTMEFIKFSLMTTALIAFQSEAFSPSNKQMDSNANLTTAGGFAIDLTSTNCCFLISFTAKIKIFKM